MSWRRSDSTPGSRSGVTSLEIWPDGSFGPERSSTCGTPALAPGATSCLQSSSVLPSSFGPDLFFLARGTHGPTSDIRSDPNGFGRAAPGRTWALPACCVTDQRESEWRGVVRPPRFVRIRTVLGATDTTAEGWRKRRRCGATDGGPTQASPAPARVGMAGWSDRRDSFGSERFRARGTPPRTLCECHRLQRKSGWRSEIRSEPNGSARAAPPNHRCGSACPNSDIRSEQNGSGRALWHESRQWRFSSKGRADPNPGRAARAQGRDGRGGWFRGGTTIILSGCAGVQDSTKVAVHAIGRYCSPALP